MSPELVQRLEEYFHQAQMGKPIWLSADEYLSLMQYTRLIEDALEELGIRELEESND